MASASLKRPSPSDVPFSDSGPVSPNSNPHWISVKRRCGEMTQPSRIFLDSAALIGPLSDDVTSLIRNEVTKQQQQIHHLQHNHHHHNHTQQQLSNQHHHNQHSHHLSHHHQPRDDQMHPQPGTSNSHQSQQNQNLSSTTSVQLDTPMLSIRQTIAICDQIIKDREQKLREEYDKILIAKLSEQHATYVKYCQDHIVRRYNENNSHQDSYLS